MKAVAPASPIRKLIRPPQKSPSPVKEQLAHRVCKNAERGDIADALYRLVVADAVAPELIDDERRSHREIRAAKVERGVTGKEQRDDFELVETQRAHRRIIPFAEGRAGVSVAILDWSPRTAGRPELARKLLLTQSGGERGREFFERAYLGDKEPR